MTIKKSELRDLLKEIYDNHVNEELNYTSDGLHIIIDSVHIKLFQEYDMAEVSMVEIEHSIKEFKKIVKKITLGNVKVADVVYTHEDKFIKVYIYLSCSYELSE